jgi:HK97 family phage portal protein
MLGVLQRAADGITKWFGGTRRRAATTAGSDVGVMPIIGSDVAGALQSSAVWACCRLVSQAISALPGQVFETTSLGKVRATKHPYYRMLTAQPNPLMTMVQWRQTTVLHLMLYGNAYTIPEYLDGEVVALWPLQPERVHIVRDVTGGYFYRAFDAGGTPHDYAPMELLHFRMFSLDGIVGLSPIEYHRITFQIDGLSRIYALNLYANGGRPQGVLEYPGNLSDAQIASIRAGWKMVHSGAANAGNIVVLEGGTKYQALAIPPEQLEFIAQQKFSVEQIARIFGVPPHLIGAMDKPTYASVEQQGLEFLQYTVQPVVTNLERTLQAMLLEDPFFYKHNLATFERSDIKTRYAAYAVARQWGFMSVNDIRELEDLNQIPEGNVYLQPLNMIPAQEAATDEGIQSIPAAGV